MGFMLDKLRERLRKKQEKANAVKNFKKIPRKDISFLPASSTPSEITEYVNNKMIALITQVGGEDKFVEGDFTVEYIDRTSSKDYISNETHTLEGNLAKEDSGGWNSNDEEIDWETKNVNVSTDTKEGVDLNTMQFYMIIIEYTEIKEVV